MDQDRIVLDRKAFGALAVDSRVRLLKALTERRKMLTELAAELGLSASATKEHLETLAKAGLVDKFDEGHKWKYYALTRKGAGIITPDREIRVWVILGISVIGLIISSLLMLNMLPVGGAYQAPGIAAPVSVAAPAPASQAPAPMAQTASGTENVSVDNSAADVSALRAPGNVSMGDIAPESAPAPLGMPPLSLYMVFSALCAVVAAVCVVYLAIDRMH